MSKRSPMYHSPLDSRTPFILDPDSTTFLQKVSSLYPWIISAKTLVSVVTERTAFIELDQIACGGRSSVFSSKKAFGATRERASATVLSSPRIYMNEKSYCDRNSCHRSCRRERS